MIGARHRRALLAFTLQSVLFLLAHAARAQETLRPQPADESIQLPAGWKTIDRDVYDAYATGRTGQLPGGLERAIYRLKLHPDGSLTGHAQGTFKLTGQPAILSLGRPSFAMSEVQLDGELPAWGCDPQGVTRLLCPHDNADLQFQCSQQGVRRGDSVEFSIDWLLAVATQLELTIPASQSVDTQGLLKTGQRTDAEGSTTLTYEAGARASSAIRIRPRSDAESQALGFELSQTLSVTPTKALLQSIIGVLSTTSGPSVVEFELPVGFTLARATLGGDERLPIDSPGTSGPLRIPLGELSAGQRVELRLVLECPADWKKPLSVPRVAPRNGVLLREQLTLQVERPLEVLAVEAPDYELTALTVEPIREVWTYQGATQNSTLNLTVRAPTAGWSADCFVKRRPQGARSEMVTLVDLKSPRSPLFEFDVEIARPWKIVSVTAPDPLGNPLPLGYQLLEESDRSVRYRILLRTPATPQRGTIVTIAVTAQETQTASTSTQPVAIPLGGRVEIYALNPADDPIGQLPGDQSGFGPDIPLSSLRPTLRTHSFFEPVRLGTLSIQRIAGPKSAPSLQSPPIFKSDPGPPLTTQPPSAPLKPLNEALAVAEFHSSIGTTTSPSTHRARFVFDDPVNVSREVVRFEGDWTLIEVLCDGTPVRAVAQSRELLLPEFSRGVRELTIRYTTAVAGPALPRRDRIDWPQISSPVESWTWRVEAPSERRVTRLEAPFEFATGIIRPGLRERLFAPLSRPAGVPIFNPFRPAAWRELLNPKPSTTGEAPPHTPLVAAVGREYPTATSIVSWSASQLYGLSWLLFIGGMLAGSIVRRFKRGTFRFAAGIVATAATAAWLLPPPFGSMAGSLFCGYLLACLIPRRLLSLRPAQATRPAGSSIVRLAGATAVLIAALFPALRAVAQTRQASTNVLILEHDGEPASAVFVSESVAKELAAWQLDQFGPPFLIRSAKYDITIDESDLASANLHFDLVVPRPDLTRSVQLPFDGLTLRGPDAALINGEVAKLVPTVDGAGILLTLPNPPSQDAARPASFRISLAAGIRVPSGSLRREFAVTIPRCNAAVGVLQSTTDRFNDFRSSSRGRTEVGSGTVSCALGTIARWHVRWRNSDVADRPVSEPAVTARAESVVAAEPHVLDLQTRLICETPELAETFASTRLEIDLPEGSIVTSVTGPALTAWTTKPEPDKLRLLLDFSSPPIVGQTVDLRYEIPIRPSTFIEIPPIPLLAPGRLSSHQIALVTNPAFQLEMLSEPNPEAGLWAVEPSEASFSLRKDRGLPIPFAALELEGGPAPLSLALNRRAAGLVAELEQSLNSQTDSIAWTGTARLETAVRPGFLYEFRVDPAVEITAASVVDRDIERLSRFVRDGDRLLLVVGDDRVGTKNVRLEGQLRLDAGKTRRVPEFDLENTVITRREIVVTSSSEQLLQIRRKGNSLVAGNEAEWEPRTPSSLRISVPTGDSDFEIRWINPASPLRLIEFLRLPDDGTSPIEVEWQLESSQPLPASLVIDVPHGTQILGSSDFQEESLRQLPGGRARIGLQSKSGRLAQARIRLAAPMNSSGGQLPRLSEVSVQPVTYLAVPQRLLGRFEIPGDFLDQLPPHAPAEWLAPFYSRELLVFKPSGIDWHIAATESPNSVGDATAEILMSESSTRLRGLTRLVISPSRAGILKLQPPQAGTLDALRVSAGALLQGTESSGWNLLLRPSQPVAVVMDWTMPAGQVDSGGHPGPVTPELNVDVAYRARVSSEEAARWTPEILARDGGAETLAAARLTSLLAAARNLPIGIRPPTWLRDELQDLARSYGDSRRIGHLAVQAEGLLDSWSARMSSMATSTAIAPQSSMILRAPQQALAEQMLVAAADPDLAIETPADQSAWSIPRRVFNAAFMTAWLTFWAFVLTKGGQWAARNQLADRLARHPGALVVVIGLAWWLLLSPSPFGFLLAAAGLLWELSLVAFPRQSTP